jgi:hypothetical protein
VPICTDVSQISPPIRIVIVAAIGLLAAWMLFLRPKTEDVPPATPAPATAPGVKGLTNDVAKAKAAAATQEASDAKVQQATGGTTATPATGTKAAPATAAKPAGTAEAAVSEDTAGLPMPLRTAIAHHQVLALLFFNPRSADDRDVQAAFAKIDHWNGLVYARAVPIAKVSKYDRVTRGVDVQQSPTVVVVDRKLDATPLVGYVDTPTIDQAVLDAIRNSGPTLNAAYLRKINDVCLNAGSSMFKAPAANHAGRENVRAITGFDRVFTSYAKDFKAVPAGAKFRALRKASVADLTAGQHAISGIAGKVRAGHGSVASVNAALVTYGPALDKAAKRFDHRMDTHHVLACGSNG